MSAAQRVDTAHPPVGRNRRTTRPARLLRAVLATACRIGIAATGLLLIGRQVGTSTELGVSAIAVLPLATVAALAAEVLLVVLRERRSAAIGAVVVLLAVAVQVPAYLPTVGQHHPMATGLTVMTSNLQLGSADPNSVVETVRANDVDVLALQELTDQAVDGLAEAGLDTLFPHRVISPRAGGAGVGLWSRLPLTRAAVLQGFGFPPVRAELTVDGKSLTMLSFHSKAPVYNGGTELWENDLRSLGAVMAATPGPLVVAGDFNATYDHQQFRDLLGRGVSDVARTTGSGLLLSYPADRAPGPWVGIDHVIVGGGVVGTGAHAVSVVGSDHRAVVAHVAMVPPWR